MCWLKVEGFLKCNSVLVPRKRPPIPKPLQASSCFWSLPLVMFSQWLLPCLQIWSNSVSMSSSQCFKEAICLFVFSLSSGVLASMDRYIILAKMCPIGSILVLCLKPHYINKYFCFLSQMWKKNNNTIIADFSFSKKKRVTILPSYFLCYSIPPNADSSRQEPFCRLLWEINWNTGTY